MHKLKRHNLIYNIGRLTVYKGQNDAKKPTSSVKLGKIHR